MKKTRPELLVTASSSTQIVELQAKRAGFVKEREAIIAARIAKEHVGEHLFNLQPAQNLRAPGLGTSAIAVDKTLQGALKLNAWMPTSVSNPILIDSTATETVSWWAIGF